MTRRGEPTITQSVPTPPHPHAVSPSHLRDRLVDKKAANPVHHPLQRQEVLHVPARAIDIATSVDHVRADCAHLCRCRCATGTAEHPENDHCQDRHTRPDEAAELLALFHVSSKGARNCAERSAPAW